MSEHDAVAFLRNAHEQAEELAQALPAGPWRWSAEEGDLATYEALLGADDGHVLSSADAEEYKSWIDKHEGLTAYLSLMTPDKVLARVYAERAILAEHEATWPSGEPEYDHHHETAIGEHGRTRYIEVRNDEPNPPYWCACCSAEAPCRTVRLLAAGWGWTEET